MPSTPTPRNRLNLQGTGDNIGSWGTVLNAQVFGLLDEALDGITTLTIAGNVSLSSANYATDQSRRRVLKLTGTPTGSFTVTLPSVEKFYLVHNATGFAQTIRAGGTGVAIPASTLSYVYCDGTNTFSPSAALSAPVGTTVDYAGAIAPAGWLLCLGQALSRTTFTSLFQAIGTAYGAGNGVTTFNIPDARGRFRVGSDAMGGAQAGRISAIVNNPLGSAAGNQFLQGHTHTASASAFTQTATSTSTSTVTNSTASLGSMSASGTTNVTYQDWTTSISSINAPSGTGTTLLVPNTGGGDVTRTVFGQPVFISLSGAPAVSSSSTSTSFSNSTSTTEAFVVNSSTGDGVSQNIPPCLVFNTIIYAGV
jgi:microcystin-dependent protein